MADAKSPMKSRPADTAGTLQRAAEVQAPSERLEERGLTNSESAIRFQPS